MKIVTDIKKLRRPTKIVKVGDDIEDVVATLFTGLEEHNIVGLSANQLGYNLRFFVMKVDPLSPICIVNPIIVKERGSQLGKELCQSLPGVVVIIKRPRQVVVKGLNQYYKLVKYKFSGLQARIACHEVDHLNGKLITDYKKREEME